MNDRDRFVNTVLGREVDRIPYYAFWGPWATTWRKWEQQGKPAEITSHRSILPADNPPRVVPVNCGPCPRVPERVIEESKDYVIHIDHWGITRKDYKHDESMAGFLDFPVKTPDDWEKLKEERFNPDSEERMAGSWREVCRDGIEQGVALQLGYFPDVGVFGSARWLLGDEEVLIALYTQPKLVHDIMEHVTSIYLTVFEKVVREFPIDVVHIWEDMCYRNGPLISPKHWLEFLGPQYRRIKAFAGRHDIPVLSVDTDGNPDLITPAMIECGVNLLFPMEVAAGADVNVWRRKYPDLALLGGIDKRALAIGPKAIDEELKRIRPALESGRYIPELDHLIPSDVSWDNYVYFRHRIKELLESVGSTL